MTPSSCKVYSAPSSIYGNNRLSRSLSTDYYVDNHPRPSYIGMMIEKDLAKSFPKMAEALLGKAALDTLLDAVTKTACLFFNACSSSIMLFDKEREYLTISRSYNLSDAYLEIVKVGHDQEIAGKVCGEKKPRFVKDIVRLFGELGDDVTAQWARQEGLVSMICAPLIVQDESIGCLNIYYSRMQESFEEFNELNFFTRLAALSIEHHRLLSDSEVKTRMFSVLGDVGLHIASCFDINEIARVFLSTAIRITNSDVGAIILVDRRRMVVVDAFEYDAKDAQPRRYRSSARLHDGISGEIIRTQKPVVIPDLRDYPNVNPVALEKGRRAVIGLPLVVRGRIIGILYVDSGIPREFGKEEVEYLVLLCNYASVAIENAKLYEVLTREAEQFAVLYDVGKSFISTLDFDQLLNNILTRLTVYFGTLNLAVFLVDAEKSELRLRAYINYPEEVKNLRIKIGETGIAGHVAGTRMMYYASDVSKDPYYVKGVNDAKSEICFPLIVGERLIGVLDLESAEMERFKEDDINLLSTLSTEIAIALDNSRLYEEMKTMSLTDPLTGLPNRRSFELFVDTEARRAERYHRAFSVLMIDFDNFKSYNDRYGHGAGDEVLKKFGRLMKNSTRDVDFLGRYGGDEFVAVLTESDAGLAREVAERMRKVIEAQNTEPKVTLSLGVATYPADSLRKEELLNLADQACYEAKQQGGNRVNFAEKDISK